MAAPVAAIGVALSTTLALPVLCPFRLCTGHACPGCGLTRATGALLRADPAASVRFHPLAIVFAIQILVLGLIGVRRRSSIGELIREHQAIVWVNAALLIATWVFRWRFGLLETVLA